MLGLDYPYNPTIAEVLMRRLLLIVALFFPSYVCAQDEAPRVGLLQVSTATPFLVTPEPKSRSFGTINAGVKLMWVEGQQDSGYFRVIGRRGPIGWVSATSVQVLKQPPALELSEAVKQPCKASLSSCPVTGCAKGDSPQALENRTKKRVPDGSSTVPLTYNDLANLQLQAQRIVGQREIPDDRSVLSNLRVIAGTVNEGTAVAVTGFIAVNDPGPHPNTGESVNCNLSAPDDNDFHINITNSSSQQEYAGIVVEMIPQDRSDQWSINKLQAIRKLQRRVLVTGALFYDSIHVVNADPKHPIGGQPRRFSLWEVHPITVFFVCGKEDNSCDPHVKTNWVPLASFDANSAHASIN
jgi:hypothetical protein